MAVKKQVDPEEFAKIAEAVGRMSDVARQMRAAGLSCEAVTVLLKHSTGVSMSNIKKVLDGAESLRAWCLSK